MNRKCDALGAPASFPARCNWITSPARTPALQGSWVGGFLLPINFRLLTSAATSCVEFTGGDYVSGNEIHFLFVNFADSVKSFPRMATYKIIRKPWVALLAIIAFWTLIGLAFASQLYVSSAHFGNPISWRHAMSNSLADWYAFALLSIPAVWFSQRYPLMQSRWKEAAAVHFGACALFSIAWVAMRLAADRFVTRTSPESLPFAQGFKDLLNRTFAHCSKNEPSPHGSVPSVGGHGTHLSRSRCPR